MNKTSKKDKEEFQSISEVFSFSPLKGIIVKDFNAIDTKLSSYFPPDLIAYRWYIVFALIIFSLFIIINLFFDTSKVSSPQLLLIQIPSAQQPAIQQPAIQQPIFQLPVLQSPISTTVPLNLQNTSVPLPINITDIKNLANLQKVGGFSNLFRELDRSLFSELNDSELN